MSGSRMLMRTVRRDIDPLLTFQLLIYSRGDCWEWRGPRTPFGYGLVIWDRWLDASQDYAHRHAYELAKGSIPRGLTIDHLCRHPWCVRPSHLEAVTQKINTRRGFAVYQHRTSCIRGHPASEYETKAKHGSYCRQCFRESQRTRRRKDKSHVNE